ncbi:hypothetical protein CYMTET_11754 [Cymbomonas tetramitiformis]|uniref:Uncharacterized protein n=1 Tax=Cymbomonas tetramitiformis TaxID=36881 RepID=A0AAE0GLM1_9CHLO|nr:hypothetical protein CYMTET_11754 [Cymbomonas tetramitiformis]
MGHVPIIMVLRELGDEHRVYHNDFTDKDLVETFLVVLEKSTNVSPYEVSLYQHVIEDLNTAAVTPAFDTVALRVRRIWQREGVSRLARFPPPTPPDSGGDGWTRRPASGGARVMAIRAAYVQEAVGEWRTTGGPYRTWEETGKPCFVCYRTWGPTDVHAETKGLCPWVCVQDGFFGWSCSPLRSKAGVDDASTDDDELFKPTLAMIAGEESNDEEWPAFATSPVWVPPTSRG